MGHVAVPDGHAAHVLLRLRIQGQEQDVRVRGKPVFIAAEISDGRHNFMSGQAALPLGFSRVVRNSMRFSKRSPLKMRCTKIPGV